MEKKSEKEKCIKKRKTKSVKKKLFVNGSSSSENEEPQYVITDNEDSADDECLYCNEPFKNDVMGENGSAAQSVRDGHMKCVQGWKT